MPPVELRQRQLDELRKQRDAGRASDAEITGAEIAVEEARLRLLECRAQLLAVQEQQDD